MDTSTVLLVQAVQAVVEALVEVVVQAPRSVWQEVPTTAPNGRTIFVRHSYDCAHRKRGTGGDGTEIRLRSPLRPPRTVKLRNYAEAGIPYHWCVEDEDGAPVVHVCELDEPTGAYAPADIFRGTPKRPVPFESSARTQNSARPPTCVGALFPCGRGEPWAPHTSAPQGASRSGRAYMPPEVRSPW